MRVLLILLLSVLFSLINPEPSFGQADKGNFTLRAGLGTDVDLGLGYGFGLGYKFPYSNFELTVVLFGHSSEETTQEFYSYTDKTELFVYGILGNYLFGYNAGEPGLFGIVGFGFSAISVDWEETSPDDTSLGPPLPDGGSRQAESGTGGGSVINAGFGYSFGKASLRAEFPLIFAFSPPGSASAVVPTFTIMLGYTF